MEKINHIPFHDYKEEEHNSVTKKLHELLKGNCYDEIIELYHKTSEKERTPEQTRCVVAALIFIKRMDDARFLLDKWQDIGICDEQWNIQYGWTYYLEQNFKAAIPYFDRVEDLNPKDTTMLGYLQECNEETGNTEEAKRIKNWIKEINTLKDTGDKYKKENYYKGKNAGQ